MFCREHHLCANAPYIDPHLHHRDRFLLPTTVEALITHTPSGTYNLLPRILRQKIVSHSCRSPGVLVEFTYSIRISGMACLWHASEGVWVIRASTVQGVTL